MKFSKWTTYVFVILSLLGCKQLLLHKMDVSQPQLETPKSITQFLNKYKVPKDIDIYIFGEHTFLEEAYRNKLSVSDAVFFNEQGYFVNYKMKPTDCNANVGPFLKNASSINEMVCDTNIHLSKYEGKLKNMKTGEDLLFSSEGPINAYVVIHWAKYLGKINVDKSFDWITVIEEANDSGSKIKLIFLNCDYQKAWNISEKDMPKFNYLN